MKLIDLCKQIDQDNKEMNQFILKLLQDPNPNKKLILKVLATNEKKLGTNLVQIMTKLDEF